ncbi:MAG: branched-chain amino acid ABC transporter permease, partial [Alphaproteobacteria bacterium]|nr:branched-chain amino acid ABC transporter permease [Alphaproteobacteria bacterium]
LFAALNFVGLMDLGVHPILAFFITIGIMTALAFAVDRLVLRPLVNQDPIILFMATIGIAFFLEGFGETLWGGDVRPVRVGIPDAALFWELGFGEILVQSSDLFAGVIAAFLVTTLALFFHFTPVGRALRAVADDHQAALSVGIPLNNIWVIVWAVAGFVALAAGIMWGAKLGVQFALSTIALKALPVLILGGFTSIPGAIIGGLIVGAGEKVFENYWGVPLLEGATEDWFAYIVAMIFLFFRPQGLFGEKIIERV